MQKAISGTKTIREGFQNLPTFPQFQAIEDDEDKDISDLSGEVAMIYI